jgi:hypothetical protein
MADPDPGQNPVVAEVVRQIGGPVGVKASLEHLAELVGDEQVKIAATAFLDGHSGLVLATDRRVMFVQGSTVLVEVPYDSFWVFRARQGVTKSDLYLYVPDRRVVLKQVHPRTKLVELANLLGQYRPPTRSGPSSG